MFLICDLCSWCHNHNKQLLFTSVYYLFNIAGKYISDKKRINLPHTYNKQLCIIKTLHDIFLNYLHKIRNFVYVLGIHYLSLGLHSIVFYPDFLLIQRTRFTPFHSLFRFSTCGCLLHGKIWQESSCRNAWISCFLR